MTTYTDTHPRQSLTLTPAQWAALDALAAELASPSLAGRSAGTPSWRTLLRDIADGKLAVVPASRTVLVYIGKDYGRLDAWRQAAEAEGFVGKWMAELADE